MKFSEELIEVFDYIGEKIGIAIDWSDANVIPYLQDLCKRFINWEITTSTIWIIISIIAIIVATLIMKYKKWDDGEKFIFAITLIAGTVIIGNQIFDIARCIWLPELQIYEYVNRMIN